MKKFIATYKLEFLLRITLHKFLCIFPFLCKNYEFTNLALHNITIQRDNNKSYWTNKLTFRSCRAEINDLFQVTKIQVLIWNWVWLLIKYLQKDLNNFSRFWDIYKPKYQVEMWSFINSTDRNLYISIFNINTISWQQINETRRRKLKLHHKKNCMFGTSLYESEYGEGLGQEAEEKHDEVIIDD